MFDTFWSGCNLDYHRIIHPLFVTSFAKSERLTVSLGIVFNFLVCISGCPYPSRHVFRTRDHGPQSSCSCRGGVAHTLPADLLQRDLARKFPVWCSHVCRNCGNTTNNEQLTHQRFVWQLCKLEGLWDAFLSLEAWRPNPGPFCPFPMPKYRILCGNLFATFDQTMAMKKSWLPSCPAFWRQLKNFNKRCWIVQKGLSRTAWASPPWYAAAIQNTPRPHRRHERSCASYETM